MGFVTTENGLDEAQRGALFENLVVTEFLKAKFNRGLSPDIYFWRDIRGLGACRKPEEACEEIHVMGYAICKGN